MWWWSIAASTSNNSYLLRRLCNIAKLYIVQVGGRCGWVLTYGACVEVVFVTRTFAFKNQKFLRRASKFPQIARKFFKVLFKFLSWLSKFLKVSLLLYEYILRMEIRLTSSVRLRFYNRITKISVSKFWRYIFTIYSS